MTRALLIAAVITLTTTAAATAGCRAHTGPVMTCADGTIWDGATGSCIPLTTS